MTMKIECQEKGKGPGQEVWRRLVAQCSSVDTNEANATNTIVILVWGRAHASHPNVRAYRENEAASQLD